MKLYLKYLVSLLTVAGFISCNELGEVRTIRLGHGLDTSHPVHKAMVEMGKNLEELSDGKMLVKIYPSQQLGTERQCLELLQIGSLDMTKVSVGTLENFAPKMRVLGLPFLFRDREHSFNVLDGPIGETLLNDGEQFWLKGLCYYDAGSRSFYTKERPVNSPKDLEGLKIRVMESVTSMNMVKELGGSPTPISWGELYTALQQGVVDGAENNPPSFYLSRHYEVCKFYSLDEHAVIPDVLLIGTHLYDQLSEVERAWLKKAVAISVEYQRELWLESEEEALEAVQAAGVEIIRPNKELFSREVNEIYDGFKNDTEFYQMIQDIRATK